MIKLTFRIGLATLAIVLVVNSDVSGRGGGRGGGARHGMGWWWHEPSQSCDGTLAVDGSPFDAHALVPVQEWERVQVSVAPELVRVQVPGLRASVPDREWALREQVHAPAWVDRERALALAGDRQPDN